MRVILIEDEPLSARRLVDMLARVAPHVEVLAQLSSSEDAVRWLSRHPAPDLIFGDIQLQDGQIFDALGEVPSVAPIIFTTAHDQFALDAFRAQGIAYLLKPFGEADLAAALVKYQTLREGMGRIDATSLAAMVRQLAEGPSSYRRHFTVASGRRIRVLPLDRVALVALGMAGIELIDTAGKSHFPSGQLSLAEIERGLPPPRFFRINRTQIVALDALDSVESDHHRLRVTLKSSDRACAVSVHRAAAFRRWLGLT